MPRPTAIRASVLAPLMLALPLAAAAADDDGSAPGDLTIAHIAAQPVGMITCMYGYAAEKEGDHATAHAIFDRCIEAGYVGAMIWKAVLYEQGKGVPADAVQAAALFRRAATSGNAGYATLGKLHYATALYLGKGVARDEAEALQWFRAAAAEGDADAQEFLRSGHHSGARDPRGRAVGAPPAD